MPKWRWLNATPVDAGAQGLTDSVGKLHKAFSTSALDDIVLLAEPFFAENELAGGPSATDFREQVGPMLKAGKLVPLPKLTATRHADGKLFRVVGADGKPPIVVVIKQGDMTNAIRMGEWWSKLDGNWKLVR